MPLDNTKRSLIRCDIVSDKFYSPTYKKQTLGVVTGDTFNILSLRQISINQTHIFVKAMLRVAFTKIWVWFVQAISSQTDHIHKLKFDEL
ncbi:hypothetical protein APA_1828 [Pseudanabaena sp. lw0831]|nr:hypothetical protein APA_1828 [Pseudanabaena sp. lw0831]